MYKIQRKETGVLKLHQLYKLLNVKKNIRTKTIYRTGNVTVILYNTDYTDQNVYENRTPAIIKDNK